MATVEERVNTLETEFRTELRHLSTKEDLYKVFIQFGVIGVLVSIIVGAAVAYLKLTGN